MKRWRRLGLQSQIFTFHLIATIFLVLIMGLTLLYSMPGIIVKEVAKTTAASIDKSGSQLEMYVKQMKGVSDLLANSPQVKRYLGGKESESDQGDIETIIASILQIDTEIASIILIGPNDRMISNEKNLDGHFSDTLKEQTWYKEALTSNMPVLTSARMQEFSMDKDNWVISIGCEVKDTDGTHLGVLRIDLTYKALETVLTDFDLGNNGFVFIVNDEKQVVYHKDTAYFIDEVKKNELVALLNMENDELLKEQKLIHSKKINNTNWLLVGVSTLDSATKMQNDIVLALFIMGSILLIITLYGSVIFAASVSKPIRQLEKIMKEVENGRFDLDFHILGSAEVQHLSQHFKSMVRQIQKLMDEIKTKEKTLRISELKTLHSQINPHFLYNTLDTIVWLAELGSYEQVVSVSKAMANFFRLSLRGGSEFTTVREELEHVRQYLVIEKERYQDKLSYEIFADESLYEINIPKIILQPIVENAIDHGIRKLPNNGMIRIEALKTDTGIQFYVEDNGVGFDSAVPIKREESKRLGGVGLQNVDERIKLYYGQSFGIKIESFLGKGTKIVIELGTTITK
jgi:two-component system, sensor histidine kinase YesM